MAPVQGGKLLVWDTDERLHAKHDSVAYWQSYDASEINNTHSIPQLVEDNASQLRSQYLALIYKLGEAEVSGKRVVKHLEIRPGFSYWWMTLLTEKCNFAKSPQIDNAIKLMAFKEWLKERDYRHISLASSNAQLANAMRLLADELGVSFDWKKVKQHKTAKSRVKRIYSCLPHSFQALVWLSRHLQSRWPLKGVGIDAWQKTTARTTFISYLFNLVPDSAKKGRFESRYWTALPYALEKQKIESNWLHIYVKDALLPDARKARKIIEQFNQSHAGSQVHVTLHTFLSVRLVLSVMRDWYQLLMSAKLLRRSLQKNSGIYWPFLEKDYLTSIIGSAAMSNLLFLNLFESAISKLPHQNKGIYLQENQGWEFGLIHSWRAAGQPGGLIGMPHTPSKFWDLRSYFDKRNYDQIDGCSLPLPNHVAINGKAAKKMYSSGGYPESGLIEVEALRYLHLNNSGQNQDDSITSRAGKNQLLVLGDYLEINTIQQMELLKKAVQFVDCKIRYLVKPHPACPIHAEDYPGLDIVVTNEPIPKLIDHCSLVYTSNTTSAAVDAYCAGKSVVTILDGNGLNLSPLKGSKGVSFVSSPKELATELNKIYHMKEITGQKEGYFNLDPDLPRWRELLEINSKAEKRTSMEGT